MPAASDLRLWVCPRCVVYSARKDWPKMLRIVCGLNIAGGISAQRGNEGEKNIKEIITPSFL